MPRKKAELCLPSTLETSPSVQISDPSHISPMLASWKLLWGPRQLPLEEAQEHRACCTPSQPYPIGAYRCPACLHSPRGARVVSKALWPTSPGLFWARPKEDPFGSEAEGKQPLLCRHPLDPEAFTFPPCSWQESTQQEKPPLPAPPQYPSFPAQHHPSPSP